MHALTPALPLSSIDLQRELNGEGGRALVGAHRDGSTVSLDDLANRNIQVDRLARDWNSATEATSREIEEVADHPPHALRAVLDTRQSLGRPGTEVTTKQEVRGHQDRAQRVAKIVAEDSGK